MSSITVFLLFETFQTGLNPWSTSIPFLAEETRSLTWPTDAITLKSGPRNFSILLTLVGDSTIIKFFIRIPCLIILFFTLYYQNNDKYKILE